MGQKARLLSDKGHMTAPFGPDILIIEFCH